MGFGGGRPDFMLTLHEPWLPRPFGPLGVDLPYTRFSAVTRQFLTDMNNRVEHQKLNQTTAELPFG